MTDPVVPVAAASVMPVMPAAPVAPAAATVTAAPVQQILSPQNAGTVVENLNAAAAGTGPAAGAAAAAAAATAPITVPKADAPPAEWDKFYAATRGVDKPEAYGYKAPEGAGDADPAFLAAVQQSAFKHGLSKKQFDGFVNDVQSHLVGMVTAQTKADTEAYTTTMTELDKEWGQTKNANLGVVSRAVVKHFGEGMFDKLEAAGLTNDAAFIKGMHSLASKAKEDSIPNAGQREAGITPDAAKAALDAMMANKDEYAALMDAKNPGHEAALRKRAMLYEQMGNAPGTLTPWLEGMFPSPKLNVQVSGHS